MPPGTAPSPFISPDAIRRLLMQGGDPSTMLQPDPSQPQPQTPAPIGPPQQAPQPGALATSMATTTPPAGSIAQSFPEPQDKQGYLAEHPVAMPTRPRGDFDKIPDGQPGADTWGNRHNTLRSVLASLFAGTAEFGGDLNHHPGAGEPFINRWATQRDAQKQYDQNAPVNKQNAENAAYDQYLGQGAKVGEIEKTGAETTNLQQNSPAMQRKAQFLSQLQGDAEDPKYDHQSLKAKYLRIAQYNHVNVAPEEIDSILEGTKPIGAPFDVMKDKNGRPEFIQTKAGAKLYPDAQGKFADPEQQKQWDATLGAHKESIGEEESKEMRVAGYAATRQAQAFANQTKMEETKKVQPHIDEALGADERLGRMETSYKKAAKGDQQAMLALLSDHLGMTMGLQKGARITKDILQEAQTSQPWLEKLQAKFDDRGILSGVALGKEQMKQMLDLGYEARDRSYAAAHDAATTYGQPLPEGFAKTEAKRTPGSKPALDQAGAAGGVTQKPKGATHTGIGSDDKKKHWLDAKGNDLGLAE